jgi:hypothetical protein
MLMAPGATWMVQRPVGALWPVARMVSAERIVTVVRSKSAVHQASQSWPMERSDPEVKLGNKWAWRAARGRLGMLRRPVRVEVMVLPSGSCTWISVMAGAILEQGPSIMMKWPLHPLSAMAWWEGVGERDLMRLELLL